MKSSNMKLGSNIISSPPKQSFLVEFNKENECENIAPTKSNMMKDSLSRNQNTDELILDEVELLDISSMDLDNTACWLLDSQDKCEENVMAWLKEEMDASVGGASKVYMPRPLVLQPFTTYPPPLKDPTTNSAALQYETLKKRAKLLSEGQRLPCISPTPTSPSTSSVESPKRCPGMLDCGDSKSQFGLKSPRLSLERRISKDSAFDSCSPRFLPLSLPKEIDDSLVDSRSSFLNKSFDDVLSAVASSPGDGIMQKSISRSQENCFSPCGMRAVGMDEEPMLGRAAGGSMNKLSNVEEIANVARLQEDHLRQTVRKGLSSKRLSQSTDRLRHTSNYSLAPDNLSQFKKIPTSSDSDDSLVSKFNTGVLHAKQSPATSSMSHPRSLPSIIPPTRINQVQSKLVLPRQEQTSGTSRLALKPTTKISTNPVQALQSSQTRIRNVSSSRMTNLKVQDKPNAATNRSFDGTPPPLGRTQSRLTTSKPVSRLQPPPGHGSRAKEPEVYRNVNLAFRSDSQEVQNKTSSVGSNSPSNHSSTDEGSSNKPSSIPMPRGIPRFSSIPRPKPKQFSK